MKIAEPNLLTLDYWRDEVSYQGVTLPSGSIGCVALNISDDVIEELKQISQPLQAVIEAVGKKKLKLELLTPCRDSILQMLELLQKENTFPLLDYSYDLKRIPEIFTEENMKKAEAYVKLAAMNLPAAMIGQRKNEEGGSFASLDEYKAVRKAGRLYRENQENTREAVKAFAEAEHCSEHTAEAHLATAIKNRSREDFYPRTERDADGNIHESDPDVRHDDHWDYASVLWGWVQSEWVREAFETLSFREQTLLEKRNAICMTCGRVSDWRKRIGFEDLAVLFEGSGASGAERAYQRALEKMMKHLSRCEVFHVLQLRLISQEKKNKKIAAAVYSYWADYDGDWGEIRFDFWKNEAEIVKLADGDFTKSQPFAKRAIQEIRAIENDKLPKKLTVPFWYEWEASQAVRERKLSCNASRTDSDHGMIIRWVD